MNKRLEFKRKVKAEIRAREKEKAAADQARERYDFRQFRDEREKAEKAAKLHFNCTGAHRMGNQWMPCTEHGDGQGSGPSH